MPEAAAETVLRTQDLVAGYVPEVDILSGVSIDVGAREMVTIVGPNGAGKSTLIKTIIGLVRPRAGSVQLRSLDIAGRRPHQIVRAGVGYVAQIDNVFPRLTVEENLELGLTSRRELDRQERLRAMYELFPRLRERRRQSAGSLSGGERQMVAMARTLMPSPDVLLLDEPSAGLSPRFVDVTFDKIAEINAAGVSILMVEQNARRALAISDRGYVLDLGRNRFEGAGRELLHDPKVVDLYLGGGARIDDPKTTPNRDERGGN
ncbi:MAG TPA: ABC transporter ATP-binding protein [Gaiellaceae bacterium]|jgi:ABC-type branched-subunit amino acid transport system ATPase component